MTAVTVREMQQGNQSNYDRSRPRVEIDIGALQRNLEYVQYQSDDYMVHNLDSRQKAMGPTK